jgi:hypothetical protein
LGRVAGWVPLRDLILFGCVLWDVLFEKIIDGINLNLARQRCKAERKARGAGTRARDAPRLYLQQEPPLPRCPGCKGIHRQPLHPRHGDGGDGAGRRRQQQRRRSAQRCGAAARQPRPGQHRSQPAARGRGTAAAAGRSAAAPAAQEAARRRGRAVGRALWGAHQRMRPGACGCGGLYTLDPLPHSRQRPTSDAALKVATAAQEGRGRGGCRQGWDAGSSREPPPAAVHQPPPHAAPCPALCPQPLDVLRTRMQADAALGARRCGHTGLTASRLRGCSSQASAGAGASGNLRATKMPHYALARPAAVWPPPLK